MPKKPYFCRNFHSSVTITRLFNKACAEYGLIADGDHILVGLSGGKDSLALIQLLGERSKIYVPRFSVTALHVRMTEVQYESDTDYLQSFCAQWGIPLIVKQASIGEIKGDKTPCFLCSWYRRKTLFDTAQALGCNKIALGHHKDDIVETLLMNLIYEGTFATNPPRLKMEKMPIEIIRPLCLIPEKDIVTYAKEQGYETQVKTCPFEKASARNDMKELLKQLEGLNPNVRESIWNAMMNVKTAYLPCRV